ncbi:L-threonylcarbamoyladenylate synthase, partial [Kerstersia sp.]|uniref:L-threonylcarbamoyladenylate synthase n=1 Tax=Kerstersia sp. TaxID=1930783 RepID=UPI003F8F5132
FARLRPGQRAGVAGPSANRYGKVSPTRAEHVRGEFPAQLAAGELQVLEGGASDVGIESTILDVSRVQEGIGPVLLRPGHITPEQIASVTGSLPARPDAQAPRASGTLKAHYAPATPVRLYDTVRLSALLAERAAGQAGPALAVVVHDTSGMPSANLGNLPGIAWRHVTGGPDAYARQLYSLLRELDAGGYSEILVQRLPEDGQWDAVRDRLGRAAAAFE